MIFRTENESPADTPSPQTLPEQSYSKEQGAMNSLHTGYLQSSDDHNPASPDRNQRRKVTRCNAVQNLASSF